MSYASDALIDAQEREIEKLKAENEKLRIERDHWHVEQVHAYGNWEDVHKYAAKLKAENADLRKRISQLEYERIMMFLGLVGEWIKVKQREMEEGQ